MPAMARQKKAGPRANERELAHGLHRELLRRVSITSHQCPSGPSSYLPSVRDPTPLGNRLGPQ